MATVKELMQLEGRVSVVTGGATGIGFRMALGLAEAGSNVVIASRKLEACEQAAGEIERAGVQALAVSCDVTKPADVDAMKEAVIKRFGRVDVLGDWRERDGARQVLARLLGDALAETAAEAAGTDAQLE